MHMNEMNVFDQWEQACHSYSNRPGSTAFHLNKQNIKKLIHPVQS